MLTINDKKNIVAEYNYNNKTCFKYDYKTDSVIEEFNRKSFPVQFSTWYSSVGRA